MNNENNKDEVVFDVKNVNLFYDNGAKQALKDINMKIYKNKVLLLLDLVDVENQLYLDALIE